MKIETKDIRDVNGMIRIYLDKTVFEITSYSENKLDVLRIRKALYGDVNKDTIERDINSDLTNFCLLLQPATATSSARQKKIGVSSFFIYYKL